MQRALGIDLGTTNSVMTHMRQGQPRVITNRDGQDLTPSAVGRGLRGQLLIGTPARSRGLLDPENTITSVKRFIGRRFTDPEVSAVLERTTYQVTEGQDGDVLVWYDGRPYSPIEISAMILRRMKDDAEEQLRTRFSRAVITVPAYFGERQTAATREAGRLAGFHVLRIVNEPTAAAMAYSLARDQPDEVRTILVYDLGGGTFDISILMLVQGGFTVLGVEGDNLLGGDDFDRALMDRLLTTVLDDHGVDLSADRRALQVLRSGAEGAKIALSAQLHTELIVPSLGSSGVTLELEIARAELEGLIRPHLERTITLAEKALADASLTPGDIDHVLLVGGSTRIPLVAELLAEAFGTDKILGDVNPMQCVALGASIQSALVADVECATCEATNPVAADRCRDCSSALFGEEKVSCPTCRLPGDAHASACWKCGAAVVTGPVSAPPTSSRRAGAASMPTTLLADAGGLACRTCGAGNRQGATRCTRCGADLAESPDDITPKDLGIELNDGRMSVIIPKNSNYPTREPARRDFETVVAGQRRLELCVYEGSLEFAQRNELCGYVTVPLPEGVPAGTPVTVSFGLDADRTITVSVRIDAVGGGAKTVRLQHFGRINAEMQRKAETGRQSLAALLDQWTHELTGAELTALHAAVDELNDLVNGVASGSAARSVDTTVAEAETLADTISVLRGRQAFISAVRGAAGRILSPTQRQTLDAYHGSLKAARDRMDFVAAKTAADNAEAEVASYGGNLRILVYCHAFLHQGDLSPALAARVRDTLRRLDEALDQDNGDGAAEAMNELLVLWEDVQQEIDEDDGRAPTVTGLREVGGG